jgi:hypothetical protein
MVDSERWTRLASLIISAAMEGHEMPEEAMQWALQVTGDLEGSGIATAELWAFLLALESGR